MGGFRPHNRVMVVFTVGLAVSTALIVLFVLRVQFFGSLLDPALFVWAAVWAAYWTVALLWVGDYPYRLRLHVRVWLQRRARGRARNKPDA